MYNVSIIGLGWVGLAYSAFFTSRKVRVIGVDVDERKIGMLKRGVMPFYEPGISELLRSALRNGLFSPTISYKEAIRLSDILFITVGTPSLADGRIDLKYVSSAVESLGKCLAEVNEYKLIVVKSTVIPGTTLNLVGRILEKTSGKTLGKHFGLCFNPEFLKEGTALRDLEKPDRIVIGAYDKKSGEVLRKFYEEVYGDEIPPVLCTNIVNAELIKYASNAFLAMKISFINTFANLCEKLPGADVNTVAKGIGLDSRINPRFLRAGVGFGGSCFRKDLMAIINLCKDKGVDSSLLESVIKINDLQRRHVIEIIEKEFSNLKNVTVAILGLSFKPNTDDLRDAPSIDIVRGLLDRRAVVKVYDPVAMEKFKKIFGEKVKYCSSMLDCIKGADCAVIVTEWSEFKNLTPDDFLKNMRRPIVVDGRRIYDPELFSKKLKYYGIGWGGSI